MKLKLLLLIAMFLLAGSIASAVAILPQANCYTDMSSPNTEGCNQANVYIRENVGHSNTIYTYLFFDVSNISTALSANFSYYITAINDNDMGTANFYYCNDKFTTLTWNIQDTTVSHCDALSFYSVNIATYSIGQIYIVNITSKFLADADKNFTIKIVPGVGDKFDFGIGAKDNIATEKQPKINGTAGGATGSVILTSPANAANLNSVPIFFNVTTDSVMKNCSLYGNFSGTWKLNETKAPTSNYTSFNTTMPDGSYIWNVYCNSSYWGTSNRTFTLDRVTPTITLMPNNFFNSSNQSTTMDYSVVNNLIANVSISDTSADIYAFEFNVSHPNGTIMFSYRNDAVGLLDTYNYTASINYSTWATNVNYTINIWASDSHTDSTIKIISDITKDSEVIFKSWNDKDISIKSTTTSTVTTQQLRDRKIFTFDFADKSIATDKIIYVETTEKLVYLPTSKYKGHFIIGDGLHSGQWLDYENDVKITPIVTEISKGKYQLTFKSAPSKLQFSSIGGLNINHKTYKWFLPASPEVFSVVLNSSSGYNPSIIENSMIGYVNGTSGTFGGLSFQYIWFRNNVNYSTGTLSGFINNQIYNLVNLSSYTASVNDSWILSVRAFSEGVYSNYVNSSSLNFTGTYIDNCSLNSIYTANISFYELSDNPFYTNLKSTIFYGITPGSLIYNYSLTKTNTQNYSLCIYPSWINLYGNMFIEYYNGTNTYTYDANNLNFSNNTQLFRLYVDAATPTSQVLFTIIDFSSNPFKGAYLYIQKYDLGTNTYKTTEIVQTDDNGQCIGNIELIDGLYRFYVYYNGNLIYNYPESGGIRILESTKTFRIGANGFDWLDLYNDYNGIAVSFTNASNRFIFTWANPSGVSVIGCLNVQQTNLSGTTTYSDDCVDSATGTINSDILTLSDNNKFIGTAYFIENGINQPIGSLTLSGNFDSNIFIKDTDGSTVFVALLVILGITLLGLASPSLALILCALGVILTFILHLYAFSGAVVIGLIIIILIHIYKNNR